MDMAEKEKLKGSCDFYIDMMYTFPHAFTSLSGGEPLLEYHTLLYSTIESWWIWTVILTLW